MHKSICKYVDMYINLLLFSYKKLTPEKFKFMTFEVLFAKIMKNMCFYKN